MRVMTGESQGIVVIRAMNYRNRNKSDQTELDLREETIKLGHCLNGRSEGEEKARVLISGFSFE